MLAKNTTRLSRRKGPKAQSIKKKTYLEAKNSKALPKN